MKVDIRLVSASNKDLLDCVRHGKFREDLYYRLNVFPIAIPPLRNRREDIPTLVRRFIARFSAEEGRTIRGISAEAMQLLQSFHWPGNVRQLENTMFRAVILCEGDEITLEHVPQVAQVVSGYEVRIPPLAATPVPSPMAEREIVRVEIKDPSALTLLDPMGDVRPLAMWKARRSVSRSIITGGRCRRSRAKLGIGRSTLYRKLKELASQRTSRMVRISTATAAPREPGASAKAALFLPHRSKSAIRRPCGNHPRVGEKLTMNGPRYEGLEARMSKRVRELGENEVRASRASRRISLLAGLLLASTALAATPEQVTEAKPETVPEAQVHAAAPAVIVPVERPANEGVLVLPRSSEPSEPVMPAELEAQRRASISVQPATPAAEPAPTANLDRIIIETPPAPAFDLSILEREKRPAEEPATPQPQQQAGPIIIERPGRAGIRSFLAED